MYFTAYFYQGTILMLVINITPWSVYCREMNPGTLSTEEWMGAGTYNIKK
jgi:hypothetical protein